jgi:sigma-B regulation protein RsbU (phosphoserine phosphatase)
MRIPIAEDERITRMTLARQLQGWGHEVTAAEDGQDACEKYLAGEFDIVITDWEMPRVSGVEFVSHIRAKPFDREELRVRLLAGERVVRLERALTNQNAELREANDRIRSGLMAAARVQQSMLPPAKFVAPGVRTAWTYIPTDELAGDAVGLHLIDDRYLVSYVLDVSGHGVPAALLSVSAMHALAPLPPETSLLRGHNGGGDGAPAGVRRPAQVAAELNRRFRASEYDGRYLTMILCVLDTREGQLRVTSAGHPPPLIVRDDRLVDVPDAGGLPIAIMDDSEYDDCALQLQPGDRVCLYSDGIVEQPRPPDNEQFGMTRLSRALASRREGDPDAVATGVVDDLTAWAGGRSFEDDVSIVIQEWVGR